MNILSSYTHPNEILVSSYGLLLSNPPHFPHSFTPWPSTLFYFPPHPSHIPFYVSLCFSFSLYAMVGGEWVCGGLICSLKRHASPSNASCRSFTSSFYPSLSVCYSGKLWCPCSTSATAYVWKNKSIHMLVQYFSSLLSFLFLSFFLPVLVKASQQAN